MPHDPARDRAIASRPRSWPARVGSLGDELERMRRSPEYAAMRRFARIHGTLATALPERARGRVRALSVKGGTATLEVADGVLLAELRATAARAILEALAAAGTGVSRLAWRVARRG